MDQNLSALNTQLKETQALARQAYKELLKLNKTVSTASTGASAGTNEPVLKSLDAQRKRVDDLIAKYKKLEAAMKSTGGGGRSGPYHGFGDTKNPAPDTPPKAAGTAPYARLESSAAKFQLAFDNLIKSLKLNTGLLGSPKVKLDERGYGFMSVDYFGKGMGAAPERIKVVLDSLGHFGKSVADLNRKVFANTPQGQRVLAFAETLGFEKRDLKSALRTPGSPYGIASFSRDVAGVTERTNLRFDKLGNVTTTLPVRKDQRSAVQEVRRDLGDLLKWSIAITAIYAPIQALSEAISQLIVNETELADVSVVLGENVASTGTVFDQVFASSQRAGESVQGVIESFGQAYRAAGRVQNQFQRYSTAVTLLNDSLALSKLSTLDQVGAIDVLTAALYQTADAHGTAAEALNRGGELLDKWVKVSRIAAVDVETLAVGVAVLGDTAETAGLSVEQLNALVATIAETSLSGGKEAANIAKALVGNYQSDSAVRELGRLGISVTDVSGKTREFLEVMTEVAAMRQSGLIGDQDFNRLTLALGGGGIRRQKDVAAFIENLGRMEQITAAQSDASGEASRALAKKLETVETSATRLGNSFQNLVQSMGDEGGLLDSMSSTIDFGTMLVNVLDDIISRTGKVGPLLLGVAAAFALFRKTDITAALINNTQMSLGTAQMITGRRTIFGGPVTSAFGGGRFSPYGAFSNIANIPSLAAIGLPAYQNFRAGDTGEGIANLIGGGLGAAAFGPVGGLIGAAIAEAFVRSTLTYETTFVNFFAGINSQSFGQEVGEKAVRGEEDLQREAFKSIGGGNELAGKLVTKVLSFMVSDTASGLFDLATGGSALKTYLPSVNPVNLLRQAGGISGEFKTTEAAALDLLRKNNPKLYEEFQLAYAAQGGTLPGVVAPLTARQGALATPDQQSYLRQLQTQRQQELTKQLVEGDIRPADYARRIAALSAFTVSATKSTSALVDEFGKLPEEFGSMEANYRDFLDIYSSGNEELINQVNQHVDAVSYLQNLWDNWKPNDKELTFTNPLTGEEVTGGKDLVGSLLQTARTLTAQTRDYGAEQIRIQQYKQPNVFGSYTAPSFKTEQELALVVSEALKAQEAFYKSPEGGAMSDETYEAFINSLEDMVAVIGESGDYFYKKVTEGVDRKFFDETYKRLQDENRISGGEGGGKPWSVVNATAADVRRAEAMAPQYVKKLESLGYDSEITEAIFTTSDDQILSAKGDQKVIQYLLQQILDTEKKQLQGIYNLPEGATAWVPYEAAMLGVEDGTDLDIKGDEEVAGALTKSMEELFKQKQFPQLTPAPTPSNPALPITRPTPTLTPAPTPSKPPFFDQLETDKESPFRGLRGGTGKERDLGIFAPLKEWFPSLGERSIGAKVGGGENAQPITTKLDIKFSSTTQLLVDGRVLATIIKPYLAADLLRTNESGGTVTRSYVI